MQLIDRDALMPELEREVELADDWKTAHEIVNVVKYAPTVNKYQYKYDHTDCIWYHDEESRCPSTCSQYRDGWNDAMDFIFKGGDGYRPYERWKHDAG